MKTVKKFPDVEQLNRFAAEKFIEIAERAIDNSGNFAVALAGGSTPKSLYQLLSSDEFANKVDWSKVFFFFGDERNVLPDDTESNYRMANENLFVPLQILAANVFRWRTEINKSEATAADYESTIQNFYQENNKNFIIRDDCAFPVFDLILLGMGDDGHTSSLFPETDALKETKKIAVANRVEKLNTTRLTLTYPVINNAANVIFLIKGADKAETLQEVLEGKYQPEKYPSQAVKTHNGDLFWLIESEAAQLLG